MSTIDIRNNVPAAPTRIRFADDEGHYGYACFVTKTDTGVIFEDCDHDGANYEVKSFDVPNLLLALKKAEDMGWLK